MNDPTSAAIAARMAAKARLAARTHERRADAQRRLEAMQLPVHCPECGDRLTSRPGPRSDARCRACRDQLAPNRRAH